MVVEQMIIIHMVVANIHIVFEVHIKVVQITRPEVRTKLLVEVVVGELFIFQRLNILFFL